MKNIALANMVLIALSAFGSMVAFAEGSVSPKGNKDVKVLAEASKTAAAIGTLKNGEEAEAVERSGMFWKIKFAGKTGFVSFLEVQRQAGGANTSLSKAIRNAAQESRGQDETSGVRARSAVMGVRGLDEGDQSSGAGNVSPNLRMVYSMEDTKTEPKEIERLGESVFDEIEKRSETDPE